VSNGLHDQLTSTRTLDVFVLAMMLSKMDLVQPVRVVSKFGTCLSERNRA